MDDPVLNYRVVGNGPPLLLVHGFGISFNIWQSLLPLLCPYFTLVMVELPGIGRSPNPPLGADYLHISVDGLDRVRKLLGFEIWDVLGYSTGSRIVEAYVKKYHSCVRQVVFLCPLVVKNVKILFLRFCFWVDGLIPATIPWLLRGWRLKILISYLGFSLKPDPHINEWESEIAKCSVKILMETARMIIPLGTTPFIAPAPFSSIWGDMDVIPLMPKMPGHDDYIIHANHAAPILAANDISDIVINFLIRSSN